MRQATRKTLMRGKRFREEQSTKILKEAEADVTTVCGVRVESKQPCGRSTLGRNGRIQALGMTVHHS